MLLNEASFLPQNNWTYDQFFVIRNNVEINQQVMKY